MGYLRVQLPRLYTVFEYRVDTPAFQLREEEPAYLRIQTCILRGQEEWSGRGRILHECIFLLVEGDGLVGGE